MLVGFEVAFMRIAKNQKEAEPAECLKGYSSGMSAQETSEFLGLPLVTLNYLPEDLEPNPKVQPDVLSDMVSSSKSSGRCRLSITYSPRERDFPYKIEVIVDWGGSIDLDTNTITEWDCQPTEYPEGESRFKCNGAVSYSQGRVDITLWSHYSSEITKDIANGITVVENLP